MSQKALIQFKKFDAEGPTSLALVFETSIIFRQGQQYISFDLPIIVRLLRKLINVQEKFSRQDISIDQNCFKKTILEGVGHDGRPFAGACIGR